MVVLGEQDVADPIFVFVKPEPHKVAKLEEGRLRLISAVSLVDTMVDRVLFGWLGKAILDNVGKTPVYVGWSPALGGWRTIAQLFSSEVLCVDKSAWDWTVPDFLVDALLELVLSLQVDRPPWWESLVRARFRLLFEKPVYRFQDGFEIAQANKGVMKSGCYLTIILNSFGQLLLHACVMLEMGLSPEYSLPIILGDDTAQELRNLPLQEYIANIESYGFKVKYEVRKDVEFAGFIYRADSCTPAYFKKHLYRMEFSENLAEYLESMQMLYAYHPAGAFFRKVANKLAPQSSLSPGLARRLLA